MLQLLEWKLYVTPAEYEGYMTAVLCH